MKKENENDLVEISNPALIGEYKKFYELYRNGSQEKTIEEMMRKLGREISRRNIIDLIGPRRVLFT